MAPTEQIEYGKRLIPDILDERARSDPARPLSSMHSPSGYVDLSYKVIANAVNRAAWWLYEATEKAPPGTIFCWVGPNDPRYMILVIAAMKCRYQALLPSPWNRDAHQRQLFSVVDCRNVFAATPIIRKLEAALSGNLNFKAGPELDELLDETPVEPFPYDATFDEVQNDVAVIVHTSGSTGPPKPVKMSHNALAALDAQNALLDPDNTNWTKLLAGKRYLLGLPSFHSASLHQAVLSPFYFNEITVYPPWDAPLSAPAAARAHAEANINGAGYAPYVLEGLAQDPELLETCSKLDCIFFGGGPLSQAAGDKIVKLTRLFTIYGTTEGMSPAAHLNDREDWMYFNLDEAAGYSAEHVTDGVYQMVARRRLDVEPSVQTLFYVFPDLDEFSPGDLISKHPTKPNLWLYRGRIDDMVVMSTGQNFDPNLAEAKIRTSALVKHCLLAAGSVARSVLVIEKADQANAVPDEEVIEQVWPLVEETNATDVPEPARIAKDHIVVAPADKPFSISGKGSIQRKLTLESFATEISKLSSAK